MQHEGYYKLNCYICLNFAILSILYCVIRIWLLPNNGFRLIQRCRNRRFRLVSIVFLKKRFQVFQGRNNLCSSSCNWKSSCYLQQLVNRKKPFFMAVYGTSNVLSFYRFDILLKCCNSFSSLIPPRLTGFCLKHRRYLLIAYTEYICDFLLLISLLIITSRQTTFL